MSADRQTLEAEVKYLLGNRTDLDAELTEWVKRAYQAITQRVEFPNSLAQPAVVSTVLSTREYIFPSDYFSMFAIYNVSQSKKLIQESQHKFLMLDPTHTGTSERYALFKGEYWIYKLPTTDTETLHLYYRRIFPDLSDATSVHELETPWDEVIIWTAAGYGFDALGEIERSIMMQRRVAGFIRQQTPAIDAALDDRNEGIEMVGL
jgi:hypothetical protein